VDTRQTIDTFIEFYRSRGHERITGSSLLTPPDDPVLFTSAGMHPLTPYLEGTRPHPLGRRLVNNQRCLRTTDLDEVGDPTHLTVFEMLGSWSLGDYPHSDSLRWGHELLVDGFGLDPGRLHVTVFGGDDEVPPDTGSIEVWSDLGVPIELTIEDNWWSNGPVGPCGPDSEIFVWTGNGPPVGTPTTDPRWVEVWNHVSMRYRRFPDGRLEPLPVSNVDTGMGLERMLTVLQGRRSVFQTDLFRPWTLVLPRLWPGLDLAGERLVLDHLRSGVVVVGDGVRPSNTGRGYVLRRLIRRALTTLWRLDPGISLGDLPDEPVRHTLDHFGQDSLPVVREILVSEERRFRALLERGRTVVSRHRSRNGGPLDEGDFHYLHDTHGLPRDLVVSLLNEG
jgi:alanyl-tRNA synthetase